MDFKNIFKGFKYDYSPTVSMVAQAKWMIIRLFEQFVYKFSNQILLGIECKIIKFIAEFVRERGKSCKTDTVIPHIFTDIFTLGVFESTPDFT